MSKQSTRKKPDAFEKAVGKVRYIASTGMGYVVLQETATGLLRAHHKKVVRTVVKVGLEISLHNPPPPSAHKRAYLDACKVILAKLKAMEGKS